MITFDQTFNRFFVSHFLSGVHGSLRTRVCRLANESKYFNQAISTCLEFSNQGSNTNSSILGNPHSSSSNNTALNSMGHSSCTAPGSTSSMPNCFLLITLSEASAVLIRLIDPVMCREQPDGRVNRFVSSAEGCLNSGPIADKVLPVRNQGMNLPGPARHWSDYLTAHFIWTMGHTVPERVSSLIKPVFLYRTVRCCVDKLTRIACLKRQQDLVTTGDTQPEEVSTLNAILMLAYLS